MTAETAASSENTPWISLSTETEARLFNLRDGRQVVLDGVDLKRVPVTILEPREQVMRQRPIAIYSWPGIPVMVIGSKPAQIRRVRDGALLAKLPAGLSTIPVLSPDGKRIALACQHILREYPRTSPNQGQTVLARDEPVIHDAFSGRKLATFAGGARDVQYTAHHTFTYKGGEGKTESAEVHDLRRGKPIGRLRGVQVDDGHEWFAVQHETARSELWRDGREASLRGPMAKLPDRAVLVGADRTGNRVVTWQADGAVMLLAGDVIMSLQQHRSLSREDAIRIACRTLAETPPRWSNVDRFTLAESGRACTDAN